MYAIQGSMVWLAWPVVAGLVVFLLGSVLWPRLRKWWKALVLGLGASVGIELVQLCLRAVAEPPYRSVDIDDVMRNTVGALFGYGLYLLARRLVRRIRRSDTCSEPYSPLGKI
jgi:glycopeptide antibiotics resistance protein